MAEHDLRDALLDHWHVVECTVAEVVDDVLGNWTTAFVVTRDDVESDVAGLVDHVRESLPGQHQPDDIQVVDRLPDDPEAAARERAAEHGQARGS